MPVYFHCSLKVNRPFQLRVTYLITVAAIRRHICSLNDQYYNVYVLQLIFVSLSLQINIYHVFVVILTILGTKGGKPQTFLFDYGQRDKAAIRNTYNVLCSQQP